MKATGIVRRIDDLGRVVVPKEIRRTLRIREGDPLEIFTDREGEIILKNIPPSGNCPHLRGSMRKAWRRPRGAWSVSAIWIRSWQQQAAGKGAYRQIYQLPAYEASGRADSHHISGTGKASVKIVSEQEGDYLWEVIHPIICEGDVIGGVILLSRDEKKKFTGAEQKVASCAADFLGRQMEQ